MPDTPVAKLTEEEARAELTGLVEAIRSADAAYYQADAPEMSDADYDRLRLRLAICIQHELDHLDGVLYIDYLSRLKRDRVLKKFQKAERLAQRAS